MPLCQFRSTNDARVPISAIFQVSKTISQIQAPRHVDVRKDPCLFRIHGVEEEMSLHDYVGDCRAKSHPRTELTTISFGGREAALKEKAKAEAQRLGTDGKVIAEDAKAGAEEIVSQAKQKAGELKEKAIR